MLETSSVTERRLCIKSPRNEKQQVIDRPLYL